MRDKLILLERLNIKDFSVEFYEIHRWEVNQSNNIILTTKDKDFANKQTKNGKN